VVADNEFTLSDDKFSILITPMKPCREFLLQQFWWLMYRDSFEQSEKVK